MDQVRDRTPNRRGVDFSFECSRFPYYQQKCLDALNTEYGLCWGHNTITAHFDVNFNHRTALIETLTDPWIKGMVDLLVTHDLPMSQASEAFELLNQKVAGKVYFRPDV